MANKKLSMKLRTWTICPTLLPSFIYLINNQYYLWEPRYFVRVKYFKKIVDAMWLTCETGTNDVYWYWKFHFLLIIIDHKRHIFAIIAAIGKEKKLKTRTLLVSDVRLTVGWNYDAWDDERPESGISLRSDPIEWFNLPILPLSEMTCMSLLNLLK